MASRNCRRQLSWLQFGLRDEVGAVHAEVVFVPVVSVEDMGELMRQFKRSNAMVPLMLTKWLETYFRSESIVLPFRGAWSSKTPVAALNSDICPSFRKAVRIPGSEKLVPFFSFPSIPGPLTSWPTRLFRKGSIILEGRSVPGPVP